MRQPESDLETEIVLDHRWRTGSSWGEPRPGDPEGNVSVHIVDVLVNIDKLRLEPDARAKLRVVALIHERSREKCTATCHALAPTTTRSSLAISPKDLQAIGCLEQ